MNCRDLFKYTVFGLGMVVCGHPALSQDAAGALPSQEWLTRLNAAAAVGSDADVAAIAADIADQRNPEWLFSLARFYTGHPSEHVLPESDHQQAARHFREALALLQGEPGRDARRLLHRTQYELAALLIRTAASSDQLLEAVGLLEASALGGYGQAALRLGIGLEDGSLGIIDVQDSTIWLRRALTAGIDQSALILSERLYDYGDDGQLEEARGMARLGEAMLRRAALEGSTVDAVALALAYLDHPLVGANPEEARVWLDFAVERGDLKAMVQLATLLADGTLGEPEPGRAGDLLLAAAAGGSVDAALVIAGSLLPGDPWHLAFDPPVAQAWLDRALAVDEPAAHRLAARRAMERGDFTAYRAHLETATRLGDARAAIDLIAWRVADGDAAGAEALMATLEDRVAIHRASAVDLAEIKLNGGPGSPVYDPDGAVRLLRAAGDRGDGSALYRLAMLHWDGGLLEQDLPQAVALLEESAATNYFRSLVQLVTAYSQGIGVEPAAETAEAWLERARTAAARQTSNEMLALGRALLEGLIGEDGVAEGVAWLERAAELGDARAMAALGNAYMSGSSGTFDPPRAFAYYQAAVAAGDHQANFQVGRAYATGIGAAMDPAAALAAYTIAAEAGSAPAAAELGLIYSSNSDVPADYRRAYDWLRRAADTGYVPAMIHIANLIEVGALDGIAGETTRAWLTRAAETGDPDAQFQLAVALKRGLLGDVDMAGAEHWMRQAAANDHFQAQSELQRMLLPTANGS